MKTFFLTKKTGLIFVGAALLISFLFFTFTHWERPGTAAAVKKPIYQGNSGQKAVAINVNVDWGEEFIPAMLEEFKKQNTEVTFFVTGVWAEKNSDLLKIMKQAGHSIQNHGYKHVHCNILPKEKVKEQITKAAAVIESITGDKTSFFAAPYGEQNNVITEAAAEINYDLVMWSIDTIDWQKPVPSIILKRVSGQLHNDAIILMHPTESTVKSLPELLPAITEQGYKILPLHQLIINETE
ncbi:MAG: polysaccharide deacetylase family protein [Syntrophomonadaceae bacterium]|nr:polysaccharide deacetylase family protein [Syntrophomonadaceae bacterium]